MDDFFSELPIVTRIYAASMFLVTLACHFELVTPFQLYYHWDLVFNRRQYWRLITCFLYFGSFGIDYLFHLFFTIRYCRMLEEGWYRQRHADFVYFLLLGMAGLLVLGHVFSVKFLGSAFSCIMVYVWARRNPLVTLTFFGLFNFPAPYFPWVMFGLTFMLRQSFPVGDALGMAIGHLYYFLQDVYPAISGNHLLKTPRLLVWLLDTPQDAATVEDATAVPAPHGRAASSADEDGAAHGPGPQAPSGDLDRRPVESHESE